MPKQIERTQNGTDKLIRSELQRQLKLYGDSLFASHVARALRIVAVWNIWRHKLYEAEGHRSMKEFCKAHDIVYETAQKLVTEGDLLHVAKSGSPEIHDTDYLTGDDAKAYLEARRRLALPLPDPNAVESDFTVIDSTEVHRVAEALKTARPKQYNPSTPSKQSKVVTAFIKSFEQPSVKVEHVIKGVFGDNPRMLKEFKALSEGDAKAVYIHAVKRITRSVGR